MKNTKISAILFGVLASFQALIVRYITINAASTNIAVAMNVEIIAVVVFAVIATIMIGRDTLACSKKAALCMGSVLYLVFLALNYTVESVTIQYALSMFGETMAANTTAVVCVFVIKIVLLIGAVAFAVLPEKKAAEPETAEEEKADAAEVPAEDAE